MESSNFSKSSKYVIRNYIIDYIIDYTILRDFIKVLKVSKKYYEFIIKNSRVKEFQKALNLIKKI